MIPIKAENVLYFKSTLVFWISEMNLVRSYVRPTEEKSIINEFFNVIACRVSPFKCR
jgi:hypothetical protein